MKKCTRCHALYSPRLIRCPECAKRELAKEVASIPSKVPPKAWIRVKKRRTSVPRKDPDALPTREMFEEQLREDATVEVRHEELQRLREGVKANERIETTSPWYGAPLTDDAPTPSRLPAFLKKTIPAVAEPPSEEKSDEFELAMESFHEWSEGLEQTTGAAHNASSSDVFTVDLGVDEAARSEELALDELAVDTGEASPAPSAEAPRERAEQPRKPRVSAASPTGPTVQPKSAEELRTHIFRKNDPAPAINGHVADATPGSVGTTTDRKFDWSFEDEPEPSAFSREGTTAPKHQPQRTTGAAAWSGRITSFVLFFTAGSAFAAQTSTTTFAALLAAAGFAAVLSVPRRAGFAAVVAVGALCGIFVAWLHTLGVTSVTWETLELPMWHGGTLATLPMLGIWLILAVVEASTSEGG